MQPPKLLIRILPLCLYLPAAAQETQASAPHNLVCSSKLGIVMLQRYVSCWLHSRVLQGHEEHAHHIPGSHVAILVLVDALQHLLHSTRTLFVPKLQAKVPQWRPSQCLYTQHSTLNYQAEGY